MNDTEKLCRFCFRHVENTYFDALGELCNILSALNLKVNMDISEEPLICVDCIESLRKLYTFKVSCVKKEDFLIPFINSHVNEKIDLHQVYLQVNGSKSLSNKNICRFCMCETPISSSLELNAIIECMLPTNYLLEFFPEIDINLVRDPIICKTCHNILQDHLTFTRNCMNVEESVQKYVKVEGTNAEGKIDLKDAKQFMDKVIIKKEIEDGDTFKHEIQHDEIVADASSKVDIKMESCIQIEDPQLEIKTESIDIKPIVNSPESSLDVASTESTENSIKHFVIQKNIKRHSVTMHKCEVEECLYETKRECDIIRHRLKHKDPSEVTYKCGNEGCPYETKRKKTLTAHKLIHRDIWEVIIYKCGFEGCLYETKHKGCLINHKLLHEDPSKVTIYKCEAEGCSYETKRKGNLTKHTLIHKDVSEVKMYKCGIEDCLHETKYKSHLAIHRLIHKDLSEVKVYKCGFEGCLYETKYKHHIVNHMLIHKDPSEVPVYKCDTEGCSYETKHKSYLIKHRSIHKNISEGMMYKCGFRQCAYESKLKRNLLKHKSFYKHI